MTYPLPSYVASIWTVGDEIHLAMPSPLDAPAHIVRFPANERGLKLALRILHEREIATTANDLLLSHKAAPTQYQIEAMYRAITASDKLAKLESAKAEAVKEKAEAEAFLAELGL